MRRARSVRLLFLAVVMSAVAAGGCRQTVMFDVRSDGGGGSGGGGMGGGGPAFCPGGQTRRLDFAIRSPDVIPALDRASAMQMGRLGNSSRLVTARAALSAIVQRYAAAVRFGYVDFPGVGLGCTGDPTCCPSDALPPSHGVQAFEAAQHACDEPNACPTSTDWPTAAALFEAARVFSTFPTRNRSYVLLLTDGQPSCAPAEASGCRLLQDQASLLTQLTVTTHVVGIELSGDEGCLDTVAARGLGNLYQVETASELNATLEAIMEPIARQACHVDVLSPPDAASRSPCCTTGRRSRATAPTGGTSTATAARR